MADQQDENTKDFSREELNVWNVEKLRTYLKNRGIVIAGDTRKCELATKVFYASRLQLPLCSTKEQEDGQIAARRKGKLFIDGIALPFLESLGNWVKGSYYFPYITMTDLEAYLSKNNNRKKGKISMKADTLVMLSIITYHTA